MTGALIGGVLAGLAVGYFLGLRRAATRVRRLMGTPAGKAAVFAEFAPGQRYVDVSDLPPAEKAAAIGEALGLPLELRRG